MKPRVVIFFQNQTRNHKNQGERERERERERREKDVMLLACLDTIFTILEKDSNQITIERDKRREDKKDASSPRCFAVFRCNESIHFSCLKSGECFTYLKHAKSVSHSMDQPA